MEAPAYYNTNHMTGEALSKSNQQGRKQEEVVARFFRHFSLDSLTACQVWQACFKRKGVPVTSVRRAITNLAASGVLEKTDQMKHGMFGKRVHTWRFRPQPPLQMGLFE